MKLLHDMGAGMKIYFVEFFGGPGVVDRAL